MEELEGRLSTNRTKGLSTAQAKKQLEEDGHNELTPPKQKPEWLKFCEQMFGGFATLLWIGSILCFIAFAIEQTSKEEPQLDNVCYLHASV